MFNEFCTFGENGWLAKHNINDLNFKNIMGIHGLMKLLSEECPEARGY
jgi:hypothetical protein